MTEHNPHCRAFCCARGAIARRADVRREAEEVRELLAEQRALPDPMPPEEPLSAVLERLWT
jgi:hypothetical protein